MNPNLNVDPNLSHDTKRDYLNYHLSGAVLDQQQEPRPEPGMLDGTEKESESEREPTQVNYDPNNENPRELLDRLRVAVAGIADDYRKGLVGPEYLEEAVQNYSDARDRVRGQIREEIRAGNSSDAPEELEKKINDALFDELVKREHDERIKARRQVREGNVVDKAVETAKNLLGTKAVKWYLGLDRKKRLAINFGIGTVAGLTFGAGVGALGVAGYIGKRIATGTAGIAVGEWAGKRWSAEELKEKEEKEVADLKNSNLSLDDKLKEISRMQQKYKKERLKMMAKKVGVTALAGAGTGLLTNLVESTIGSTGGSGSVLEGKKGGGDMLSHRTQRGVANFNPESNPNIPRSLFVEIGEEAPVTKSADITKVRFEELNETPVGSPKAEVVEPQTETPKSEVAESPESAKSPETQETPFNPEILKHEWKEGDSTWKVLKEILSNDEKFKNLSGTPDEIEAKQTRVLQGVLGKALKDHGEYNIGPNGEVVVGEKTDFSKLFSDPKEIEKIIGEAENLKPAQISSILGNNRKIEAWLAENPGKALDLDEIIAQKPKVFEMPKTPTPPAPELLETPELNKPKVSGEEGMEILKSVIPEIKTESMSTPLPEPESQDVNMALAGVAGLALVKNRGDNITATQEESVAAKRKFGILEGGRDRWRTMSSDTSIVAETAQINAEVTKIFNDEIDNIYGESQLFGLKKTAGVDTKEWKTISGLPARRVLEYFKSPETSDLPETILHELQTSEKHRQLVELTTKMVEEVHKYSNADFEPRDNNESMENYIKGLGVFLVKQKWASHVLNKAA